MSALSLLAAALLAAAPVAGAAPAGTAAAVEVARPLVAEVDLRLPPGETEEAYRPLLGIRPGDPVTPRALQRLVRSLYQTGKFGNVLVFSFPVPGTVRRGSASRCAACPSGPWPPWGSPARRRGCRRRRCSRPRA